MGQQHRKETKRRRRGAYLKRKKEMIKLAKTSATIPLARKVAEVSAEA